MQRECNDLFNLRTDIRQDCVSLSALFTSYLEKKKKNTIFSENTRVIGRKLENMCAQRQKNQSAQHCL